MSTPKAEESPAVPEVLGYWTLTPSERAEIDAIMKARASRRDAEAKKAPPSSMAPKRPSPPT